MKRGGWPRPPLILALILGSIMENAFQISMGAHDGAHWLYNRPIVLIIYALIIITILLAAKGITKNKRTEIREETATVMGEGSERNPMISFPFSILLFVVFISAIFESQGWFQFPR